MGLRIVGTKSTIDLLVLVSLGAGSLSVQWEGSGGMLKAAGPSMAEIENFMITHLLINFNVSGASLSRVIRD